MRDNDAIVIEQLAKYAGVGAFFGMVAVGGVLWFDVSSIGSMFNSGQHLLLANVFLAGGMLKGALLGVAIGSANLSVRRRVVPVRSASHQAKRLIQS